MTMTGAQRAVPVFLWLGYLSLPMDVRQRQANRLPGLGTSGHGLGKFHILGAGGKIRKADFFLASNGTDKFRFHPPSPGFISRNIDGFEL